MMIKHLFLIVLLVSVAPLQRTFAQAQELEQLSLDITKLLQFRKILSDMKDGYQILTKGYGTIRDISQGSFDLHRAFLDGLLQVSPTVRQYGRIAQIIDMQVQLVKDYKAASKRFSISGVFDSNELDYIGGVYQKLVQQSLNNVSDLTMVVTAGKLRMSDDERVHEVDRIYADQRDQLNFLRLFNNKNAVLLVQRMKEKQDVNSYYYWYDK